MKILILCRHQSRKSGVLQIAFIQSGWWPLVQSRSPCATTTSVKGPLGGPYLEMFDNNTFITSVKRHFATHRISGLVVYIELKLSY